MIEKKIPPFAVFDIESNKWIDLEVLAFYDGHIYKVFTKIPAFLNFLDSRFYRSYRIYAHNGGKFDFLFLMEEILNRGWKVKLTPRQGSIIIIHVTTAKGNHFTLCDSYALLPDSLKRLTEGFQVEHKKMDSPDFKRRISRRSKKLMKYLHNDILGLYEVLTEFFNSTYVVRPAFTIASQALNTFKEKFLPFELQRMNLNDEELIRSRFYSGGRVEVYKGEGKHIRVYDVNSLYPYAMLSEMPCGNYFNTTRFHPDLIGFYKVKIHSTPEWIISPLLVKVRKGKNFYQNYYVNGGGTYFLTSETLLMLKKDYGVRFEVEYGMIFKRKKHLFNDYVETFYKIKSENRGNSQYYIAKYMLNALYGKLGQMRWTETIQFRTKGLSNFVSFDDYYGLVMVLSESRSKFILPFLACYITETARLHHFKLMREIEKDVFYCDTDSIFTTSRSLDKKVTPKIGDLSFEGEYEGIFLAPKTYGLRDRDGEHITFKGFDPKEFTYADFERASRGLFTLSMKKKHPLSFIQCSDIEKARADSPEKIGKLDSQIIHERGKYLKVAVTEKRVLTVQKRRIIFPSSDTRFDSVPFDFNEVNSYL